MTNVRGLLVAGQNQALDAVFGSGTPATLYAGLAQSVTGSPLAPSGEPTIGSNGYARVAITNNATNWPAASAGAKTCQVDVVFPTSSGAWASGNQLTVFVLYDSTSGGAAIGFATLSTPIIISGAGITVKLLHANNDLQVSITGSDT